MPPKVVLSQNLSPEQKEQALGNGAALVFGSDFIETAAEVAKVAGGQGAVFAGECFEELDLPDTVMIWAILVYAHRMPGPPDKAATDADLKAWRDRLFDRVDFVKDDEPMPKVEMNLLKGTREVTLQLLWMPPGQGNWHGVYTDQIKRIAGQFEARYNNAVSPPKAAALPGSNWQHYAHPDSLFSIAHPGRWPEVPTVSDGASLSCRSGDGGELLEVVVGKAEKQPAQGDIADIFADGAVLQIKSFANARILDRKVVARGTGGRCISVLAEHRENGHQLRSEYYIVSAGRDGLYVALKCLASRYSSAKLDFDKACASLATPWISATGHGGQLTSTATASSAPSASSTPSPSSTSTLSASSNWGASPVADEPLERPKRSSGLIWWVLAIAAVAAGAYYFMFGMPRP